MGETQTERALRLAHHVGMPFDVEKPNPYCWDGTKAHLGGITPSNIVHEIAHWLVCPVRYRKLVDFGLGAGPDTNGRDFSQAVSDYATRWKPSSTFGLSGDQKEEEKASMLGILIEKAWGWDWAETAIYHIWISDRTLSSFEEFAREQKKFCRNKTIYDKGVPRCLRGFS